VRKRRRRGRGEEGGKGGVEVWRRWEEFQEEGNIPWN